MRAHVMEGKEYLVTGGTGFLGSYVIPAILERGGRVRLFCRSAQLSQREGVTCVVGSILSDEDLAGAAKGCDGIFHLAGVVIHSRTDPGLEDMWKTNVDGTLAVIRAASAVKCRRVVYASSSGVVGCSADAKFVATDKSPYCKDVARHWPYYMSKIEAEEKGRELAKKEGVDLISMRPTMMWGPGDDRFRSTKLIFSFLTRHIPFVPPGGASFLDVRDAADAFVEAMTRGKDGATYLLGAQNWTTLRLFEVLEKISGVPRPSLSVPGWAARAGATALDSVNRYVRRKYDPSVDPVRAEMGCHYWYLSWDAAKEDLAFHPRSPVKTISETISFIRNAQLKSKL